MPAATAAHARHRAAPWRPPRSTCSLGFPERLTKLHTSVLLGRSLTATPESDTPDLRPKVGAQRSDVDDDESLPRARKPMPEISNAFPFCCPQDALLRRTRRATSRGLWQLQLLEPRAPSNGKGLRNRLRLRDRPLRVYRNGRAVQSRSTEPRCAQPRSALLRPIPRDSSSMVANHRPVFGDLGASAHT